jgi:outer membrane protein OmpA-like peptidoglycan-associated protein
MLTLCQNFKSGWLYMTSLSYLIVSTTALSICMIGCRKTTITTPPATPVYDVEKAGIFFSEDDILEMSVPDIGQTLFDDQIQQDLGITIFAEQIEAADDSTRTLFRPLYFQYDKHTLKSGQQASLEHNIAQAKKLISQGYTIVLEGHACTSGGSESYNMHLSERRAQEIKKEFVRKGLPADKIMCVGRGTSQCIIADGSQEQQAPNRRVELVGIKK